MNSKVVIVIKYSLLVTLGATGGFVVKRFIMQPNKNIVGFDPSLFKPDAAKLISDIEKEGFSNATKKHNPVDIANYAMEKYKTYENSVSIGYGQAETIVNQEIRSGQIKVGNHYFEENVSKSSMVGVGKRFEQNGIDSDTFVYNENSAKDVVISNETASTKYNDKPDEYSVDKYKEAWGRSLSDMFIYCVHEKTVLNQSIDSANDEYSVHLELDPDMGGYNYRYQMKTISDLDSLPVFEFIKLDFTLDNTLNLVHLHVNEKYKATKFNTTPEIENTIDYDFFPNLEWKIPSLNEDIDYKAIKEYKK